MERVQIVGAEAKDQGGQYFWKMSSGNIVYHCWSQLLKRLLRNFLVPLDYFLLYKNSSAFVALR